MHKLLKHRRGVFGHMDISKDLAFCYKPAIRQLSGLTNPALEP
jgi:hypothetical protein